MMPEVEKAPLSLDSIAFGRRFEGLECGATLRRTGSLEVRLARNSSEIAAAQEMRYRIFYEELGARREVAHALDQRDCDRFDTICDHLLVFDTAIAGPEHCRIVGTYRLLRQEIAAEAGGFYSNNEFELDGLVNRHPDLKFLELGRSCVLPAYRAKRTIDVLWQGIWAYINHYSINVMTGCASFHGTNPSAHAEALSYLAHHCRVEGAWAVSAKAERYVAMDMLPPERVNTRSAIAAMPPLIKGYLRLGARIGEGCVIDNEFHTTDILIVLPVAALNMRYVNYYASDAESAAA